MRFDKVVRTQNEYDLTVSGMSPDHLVPDSPNQLDALLYKVNKDVRLHIQAERDVNRFSGKDIGCWSHGWGGDEQLIDMIRCVDSKRFEMVQMVQQSRDPSLCSVESNDAAGKDCRKKHPCSR